MSRGVPESDWKVFRELHRVALDRYCQQVLDEVAQIASDTKGTAHERYLKIFKAMRERDQTVRRLFDDLRRSTAIMQLFMINAQGLITEEEIRRFTQGTRDLISSFSANRTQE